MAVVVNEFEVVPAEQAPVAQGSETSATATESAPALSAREVARLLEREHERLLRVWAH